jgi:hypothetical protein
VDLGRRAWQEDADGPLGPTRRGLAAGARFELSRCARGMGKTRPVEAVRGPNAEGRAPARGGSAARSGARPSCFSAGQRDFDCVFLQKVE